MTTPVLSILTPAVLSRIVGSWRSCGMGDEIVEGSLLGLAREIERQTNGLPVEHLIFCDNKRRTVGEKRDALLRMARGKYVAFVDDDDGVSDEYVNLILHAAEDDPDVITFEQRATVNGAQSVVQFKLGNPNGPFNPNGLTRRNAWHVCAWRRSLAVQSRFPASNYGEDWAFAAPLCALPDLREVHIPKVLHFYRHDAALTEAPPPASVRP